MNHIIMTCFNMQEKYIWTRVWRNILCCSDGGVVLLYFYFHNSSIFLSIVFLLPDINHLFNTHVQTYSCIRRSPENFWAGGCRASASGYKQTAPGKGENIVGLLVSSGFQLVILLVLIKPCQNAVSSEAPICILNIYLFACRDISKLFSFVLRSYYCHWVLNSLCFLLLKKPSRYGLRNWDFGR